MVNAINLIILLCHYDVIQVGILSAVNDFSYTVRAWDGESTQGLHYLKSFNYLPQECQQMQSLSDHMSRVQNRENLEKAAHAMLKYLGKLKRPYLTAVEEKLLGLIEKEYGIDDRFGFELNNGYDCNYL